MPFLPRFGITLLLGTTLALSITAIGHFTQPQLAGADQVYNELPKLEAIAASLTKPNPKSYFKHRDWYGFSFQICLK